MAITKDILTSVPRTPGVYIFRHGNRPIYIGKAADLRKRLASYFRLTCAAKTKQLVEEATKLDWYEAESEIDALIKEADLIKTHLPRFNVIMRDDKNYLYVAITEENFPKIFLTHQLQKDRASKGYFKTGTAVRYIGPFTSGYSVKMVLRMLRRAFPYCTCVEKHKRPCLNSQIGRCPGYCCMAGEPTAEQRTFYRENIKNIVGIFTGRKKKLFAELKRAMTAASKAEDFETAATIRDQVLSIENIFRHNPTMMRQPLRSRKPINWRKAERIIRTLIGTDKVISRVEGYDISNISGTESVASMVVFINGMPDTSEYRKFRIKTIIGANDVASHREVIRRRLARADWPRPDLLLIDGGKPQINAVRKELRPGNEDVALAALAKREEELFMEGREIPQRLDTLPPEVQFFFQRVRDESHRFAKKYHHKRREMVFRAQARNAAAAE